MASRQLSTDDRLPSFYKIYRKALNNFLLYFYIYGIARESQADRKGPIAYERSN
ncbi:UNVERIFIED_ORG: hypothetical protein J3D59_005768 [Pseudomonas fluorescens]